MLMNILNFKAFYVGSEVTSNRWRAASINQVHPKGLSGLENLRPFDSINPIVELHVTVNQSDQEIDGNQ